MSGPYLYCQSCGKYLGSLGGSTCNWCGWEGGSPGAEGAAAMLAAWTEILPLFVVRWLARKHCERFHMGVDQFHGARPGIFVIAQKEQSK